MKQGKIIEAYKVLQRLSALPLPLTAAYGLHKLRNALQSQWDFQLEQEDKVIQECDGIVDENGIIHFPDDPPRGEEANETNDYGKSREEFNKRINELSELDAEVTLPVVSLSINTPGMKLSMNDLAALDGFVEITGA